MQKTAIIILATLLATITATALATPTTNTTQTTPTIIKPGPAKLVLVYHLSKTLIDTIFSEVYEGYFINNSTILLIGLRETTINGSRYGILYRYYIDIRTGRIKNETIITHKLANITVTYPGGDYVTYVINFSEFIYLSFESEVDGYKIKDILQQAGLKPSNELLVQVRCDHGLCVIDLHNNAEGGADTIIFDAFQGKVLAKCHGLVGSSYSVILKGEKYYYIVTQCGTYAYNPLTNSIKYYSNFSPIIDDALVLGNIDDICRGAYLEIGTFDYAAGVNTVHIYNVTTLCTKGTVEEIDYYIPTITPNTEYFAHEHFYPLLSIIPVLYTRGLVAPIIVDDFTISKVYLGYVDLEYGASKYSGIINTVMFSEYGLHHVVIPSPDGSYIFFDGYLFRVVRVNVSVPAVAFVSHFRLRGYIPARVPAPNGTYVTDARLVVSAVYTYGSGRIRLPNVPRESWWSVGSAGWGIFPGGSISVSRELSHFYPSGFYFTGRYTPNTGFATFGVYLPYVLSRGVDVASVSSVRLWIGYLYGDVRIEKASYWDKVVALLRLLGLAGAGVGIGGTAISIAVGATSGAYVAPAVGGAIALSSVVIAGVSSYETDFYIIPIALVKYVPNNTIYAVSYIFATRDEQFWQTQYFNNFRSWILENLRERIGRNVRDVLFRIYYIADSTRQLIEMLRSGRIRSVLSNINYKTAIEDLLVYGKMLPEDKLRLVGIVLLFGFVTYVRIGIITASKTWSMNITISNVTLILTPIRQVITNPADICDILWRVYLAGKGFTPETCDAEPYGAVYEVHYLTPRPVHDLLIVTGAAPVSGEPYYMPISGIRGTLYVKMWIVKPCRCNISMGICNCTYIHNMNIIMRLDKVYLLSMPSPPVMVERIYRYRYGTFRNIVYISSDYLDAVEPLLKGTEVFEMWKRNGNMFKIAWRGETWINGKMYPAVTLTTVNDTVWIDPTNGGTLEPGKYISFIYFFKPPSSPYVFGVPDVAVKVLFNGTTTSATYPRHISIQVESTVHQYATINITIIEWAYNRTIMSYYQVKRYVYIRRVEVDPAYPRYICFSTSTYVSDLLPYVRAGIPCVVEIVAKVVSASVGDWFKANSEDYKYLPVPPQLYSTGNASLIVHVYYGVNRTAIPNATVRLYEYSSGRLILIGVEKTNSSGDAVFTVPISRTYLVTARRGGYRDPNIATLPNGTEVRGVLIFIRPNTSMAVVNYMLLLDSDKPTGGGGGNATRGDNPSPGGVNHGGSIYYLVEVQVMYSDNVPIQGAHVQIFDVNGTEIANGTTDYTGFAYFWIRNGTRVKIHVEVSVNGHVYSMWRNGTDNSGILINCSRWFVFTIPIRSTLFKPEVAIVDVEFLVHRGLTVINGSVRHLVVTVIYSNVRQRITLMYQIWKVDRRGRPIEPAYTFNRTVTVDAGTTVLWCWARLREPGYYRTLVEIVKYENDTDLTNNKAWSNIVHLSPYVDAYVRIRVEQVKSRVRGFTIPGDVLRVVIYVGCVSNVNYTMNSTLRIRVDYVGYVNRSSVVMVHVPLRCMSNMSNVEINRTIVVPYCWYIHVHASLNVGNVDVDTLNNNASITVKVDPNLEITSVETPGTARSGSTITVKINVRDNLPPRTRVRIFITFPGCRCTTSTTYIIDSGNVTIRARVEVPRNPTTMFGMEVPIAQRNMTIYISAPDVYDGDNTYSTEITVLSSGTERALLLGGAAAAAIIAIAVILHLAHHHARTVERRRRRMFKID